MSQLHVCLVPTLAASVNHSVTSFPPSCMIEFKSGLITVKVISRNESRMMSRHFLKVFVTCWARSQRADFTFMLGTDLIL